MKQVLYHLYMYFICFTCIDLHYGSENTGRLKAAGAVDLGHNAVKSGSDALGGYRPCFARPGLASWGEVST